MSEHTEAERMQAEAALVNRATSGIIEYMLERGPIAPSSELRHFVKQEVVELLAALRAVASPAGEAEREVIEAAIAFEAKTWDGLEPAFRFTAAVRHLVALRASAPAPLEQTNADAVPVVK